jgi:hypothetical protein
MAAWKPADRLVERALIGERVAEPALADREARVEAQRLLERVAARDRQPRMRRVDHRAPPDDSHRPKPSARNPATQRARNLGMQPVELRIAGGDLRLSLVRNTPVMPSTACRIQLLISVWCRPCFAMS